MEKRSLELRQGATSGLPYRANASSAVAMVSDPKRSPVSPDEDPSSVDWGKRSARSRPVPRLEDGLETNGARSGTCPGEACSAEAFRTDAKMAVSNSRDGEANGPELRASTRALFVAVPEGESASHSKTNCASWRSSSLLRSERSTSFQCLRKFANLASGF